MIVYVNAFTAPYNPTRIYFSMDYPTKEKANEAILLNQDRFIGTYPVEVDDKQYNETVARVIAREEKGYY